MIQSTILLLSIISLTGGITILYYLKKQNSMKNEYKLTIETELIDFTGNISDKFNMKGIEVEIDFNICSYNEKYAQILTNHRVEDLLLFLSNRISPSILTAMREEKVKIYLRDAESIQMKQGYCVAGYYSPQSKQIHVALRLDGRDIKTLCHEIGHFIDNVINDEITALICESTYYSEYDYVTTSLLNIEREEKKFREYARTNEQEFIAVAFENFLRDRSSLDSTPSVKALVEEYLKMLEKKYYSAIIDNGFYTQYYNYSGFDLEDTLEITDEEYFKVVVEA